MSRSVLFLLAVGAILQPACGGALDPSASDDADLSDAPSHLTAMPTGNGFGFAVYSPDAKAITKLYAHPYRFMHKNASDPKGDGIETANLATHVAWKADAGARGKSSVSYARQSHVIDAKDDALEQSFFMPFGVARNVLVTAATAPACLEITWAAKTESPVTQTIAGRSVAIVAFKNRPERVVLVPLDPAAQPRLGACVAGSSGWALVALEASDDPAAAVGDVVAWQKDTAPTALASREEDALDAWRVPVPAGASDIETKVWRQSETILRIAQIREPNDADRHANGLIVASLPDGEWFIPWVRDMSYATVALTRMGHRDEARAALTAYLDARPVGTMRDLTRGLDYQISTVRYFGDGGEEADFSGEDDPNLEFDSWGLALWAIGEYLAKFDDKDWLASATLRGTAYESARDFIVKPLLGNVDAQGEGQIVAADTSVWEQNDQPRMHYAASTIAALNGLGRFAEVARLMGDGDTEASVNAALARLDAGFASAFVKKGRMHGVLENSPKNDMDGAVLEAINFGVETDANVVSGTLAAMPILQMASGGYRRVTGDTSYESHEFVFIDFALARAYLRTGRATDAANVVARIVKKVSLDNGLFPEMYVSRKDKEFPGKIGDPTGAKPMVGYGAGVYALYLMERAAR